MTAPRAQREFSGCPTRVKRNTLSPRVNRQPADHLIEYDNSRLPIPNMRLPYDITGGQSESRH